jgi:hypothetical protein
MKTGQQIAALFIVGALMVLVSPFVQAEPYFAIMTNQSCQACHVNQTGGGKRTVLGTSYAQTLFTARPADKYWDGKVSEYLAIGGNFRSSATATETPNQDDEFEFDLDEALFFMEVPVIADSLTFYFDQQFAPSSSNREAVALLQFPEQSAYIKVGKFFLPHGWRLEDDTEFVRQATGLNMENSDNGIESGIVVGPANLRLAITNGTAGGGEVDTGKQFSLHSTFILSGWQIGASANFNDAEDAERTVWGVFGGVKTGPVSWLGEIDHIDDDALGPTGRKQWAAFVEANWWIQQGHNLKISYGYFDPDDDLDEDERNRYSVVYEYFPMVATQLRTGLRFNDGIPQNDAQNADLFFVQLNGYF